MLVFFGAEICAATISVTLKLETACESLHDLLQVGRVLPTDILDFLTILLLIIVVVVLTPVFLLLLVAVRQVVELVVFFLLPCYFLLHSFKHLLMIHIIEICRMATSKELASMVLC